MLEHLLNLSAYSFCIGIFGLIKSQNMVQVVMWLELMFNAVNINLITFSNSFNTQQTKGKFLAILIIAIAAPEAATRLAMFLAIYCNKN